jgi:hypothetical protein
MPALREWNLNSEPEFSLGRVISMFQRPIAYRKTALLSIDNCGR